MAKKRNCMNDEEIVAKLQLVIDVIEKFPMHKDLVALKEHPLRSDIIKSGGLHKYAELMNYPSPKNINGYWTDITLDNAIKEAIKYYGYFPTQEEIKKKYKGLLSYINTNGGINLFRRKYGYEPLHVEKGHYTIDKLKEYMDKIVEKIGYFPTEHELSDIGESRLMKPIQYHGGFYKVKQILGYKTEFYKEYSSYTGSYVVKRGKSTENIVYSILKEYCSLNNLSVPKKNVRLSKGNIIEFVCNTNKTIGIDVTNTMCRHSIYHKWTKKDYYKYLDELWIVVVSDSFTEKDYTKWNNESPDNVYIYDIEEFCDELQLDLDETIKNKIDRYKSCTFHTREQYKKEKEGSVVTS